MASQPDLPAAKATAEPRRKLGSLRMVWHYASNYPLQLVIAAIALGIAALATLAIPYQFKAMIVSGSTAGGGDVAPHFRHFYAICVALALATALRFYFVSWLGERTVADIHQAYDLLSPMLGGAIASVLFATALLASGQNSTVTATLAGQIVMEGSINAKIAPWARRLATRLLAIVPAVIVASLYGESGTTKLLISSQVILSLQLPFAVVPLVRFTSDARLMGEFANRGWVKFAAWGVSALIIGLNLKLVIGMVTG